MAETLPISARPELNDPKLMFENFAAASNMSLDAARALLERSVRREPEYPNLMLENFAAASNMSVDAARGLLAHDVRPLRRVESSV